MTNEHMTTALCMTEVCGYKIRYYVIQNIKTLLEIYFYDYSFAIVKSCQWDQTSSILEPKSLATGKKNNKLYIVETCII